MTSTFWKRFFGTFFIAFFSLLLSRLVFAVNLHNYFEASFGEYLNAFIYGLRFDWVSITILLGPVFLALPFFHIQVVRNVSRVFFLGMLAAMNLFNCIDAEFFKFTARRSTDDFFEFAFLSDDLFHIAPNLLAQFWYLLVAFGAIMLMSAWLYNKWVHRGEEQVTIGWRFVALLPIIVILIVGFRGGVQGIPLTIIDAGTTSNPQLNFVVLNTPFTILKTLGKPELREYNFVEDEKADISPITVLKPKAEHGVARGNNVVIIIVESLATEYVGFINGLNETYTPFLDSLCEHSKVFANGFANGHRSIEGIPAVMASMPTLMYEAYSTSRYGGNRITSLASVLKKEGYFTSFMHGGNENTMNFNSFANQAGFDLFYDRDDYPFPDKHYDGYWGISDHYFLNHCIDKFTAFEKPFLSGIFTLSSHHPYSVPKAYQGIYPKGTLPIHESMGYTDESLRQFFKKASGTDWYDSTLFVITADHTSLSDNDYYQTLIGSLRIPIILYHPNDSLLQGIDETITQQADIMPTVLDLLGYEKPFFTFGVSVFDTLAVHSAVAFKHDQHQVYTDGILTCFDGEEPTFIYNVATDPLLKNNLAGSSDSVSDDGLRFLKAYIENYSTALIHNRMTYESWTEQTP